MISSHDLAVGLARTCGFDPHALTNDPDWHLVPAWTLFTNAADAAHKILADEDSAARGA